MSPATRVSAVIVAYIHLCLGVVVLFGDPIRFSSSAWVPLQDMTPGSDLAPWGVALVFSGSLILSRVIPIAIVGLAVGTLVMNMWAALFWYAAHQLPDASITGIVSYGGYAVIDSVLGARMFVLWRRARDRQED